MLQKTTLKIGGMTCAACSANVQKALLKTHGITFAEVNIATNKASLEYDDEIIDISTIKATVKSAGYYVVDRKQSADLEQLSLIKEQKKERIRLILSIIFTVPLFYIAMAHMISFVKLWYPKFIDPNLNPVNFAIAQFVLALTVAIICFKFYKSGYLNLFKLHPNMDSLVAVSTTAAFVYSTINTVYVILGDHHSIHNLYFESVGVILTLILCGKYMEAKSKGKTGQAIKELMSLAPKTAIVIKDGKQLEIMAEDVKIGDTVLVKPGQSLPVDGVVLSGSTTIDESMLTGESLPVDKKEGDSVFAATVNRQGSITFKATKTLEDTTLYQIIDFVEQAAGSKAPIAHLADVISGYFTPIVMLIALISGVAWYIYSKDIPFALNIFISVLVIACPCALGLATPTAIIVATGRAASLGVLFKNATALQNTHKIKTAIFDKTGTITEGKPKVCDIITKNIDKEKLLQLAASVENVSEHPLGKAIVEYAKENEIDLLEVTDFLSVTGFGVSAKVDGKDIKIGNADFANANDKEDAKRLSNDGKTPMFVTSDGELLGIIAVADAIKDTSRKAILKLSSMGIETVMLTGDNEITANAVAKEAGIKTVVAGVLPEQKASYVEKYKKDGNLVCMVGDGINDAPALTVADIGIAVGSGTDVAIESADVILVKNDLNDVVTAINISKKAILNIKENLFWAFCYNTLGIPIAAGVLHIFGGPLLSPMFAAAAMSLSSVCVVTNALRLNKVKIDK